MYVPDPQDPQFLDHFIAPYGAVVIIKADRVFTSTVSRQGQGTVSILLCTAVVKVSAAAWIEGILAGWKVSACQTTSLRVASRTMEARRRRRGAMRR